MANAMLGALIAEFIKVLDYYFGSSAGSAAKTKVMAAIGKGYINGILHTRASGSPRVRLMKILC